MKWILQTNTYEISAIYLNILAVGLICLFLILIMYLLVKRRNKQKK